jgi:hypothetical protein
MAAEEGQEETPGKKRVGRPNDPVWEHFVKQPKASQNQKFPGECKHCNHLVVDGRPDNLYRHIAECPKATEQIKADCAKWFAKKAEAPPRKQKKQKTSLEAVTESKPIQAPQPLPQPTTTKRPLPAAAIHAVHSKLLKMIIMSGSSFRLVDNPYFKDFLHTLCPSYDPPGELVMSHLHITHLICFHVE